MPPSMADAARCMLDACSTRFPAGPTMSLSSKDQEPSAMELPSWQRPQRHGLAEHPGTPSTQAERVRSFASSVCLLVAVGHAASPGNLLEALDWFVEENDRGDTT